MLSVTLCLLSTLAASAVAQRTGINRNVIHYTPLKFSGPPVATLGVGNEFNVYYQSPATQVVGPPFLWKSTHTKDFIHWEDGEAFFKSTAAKPASYGFGVVYPNVLQPIPQGDTKYTVLTPRLASDGTTALVDRGTDDGLSARVVKVPSKKPWNLPGVTSADAFPLTFQGKVYHNVAYLKDNSCGYVYFTLDNNSGGTTSGGFWETHLDPRMYCYELNVKQLSDTQYVVAMTVDDTVLKARRTQYWTGTIELSGGVIFHPDAQSMTTKQYLDVGTDAGYFRLARAAKQLRAIGYVNDFQKGYPAGMSVAFTLFRTLTYKNGLQQDFVDMSSIASYKMSSLPKDFVLTTSACSGHLALNQRNIPQGDAGWVFNFMFDEANAQSGWGVQFQAGALKAPTQYLTLTYDGSKIQLDRSHATLGSKDSASAVLTSRRVNPVKVVLDHAMIEVFVNSDSAPTSVLTMSYKTSAPFTDVCMFAKGPTGTKAKLLKSTSLYQVPSIWGSGPTVKPTTYPHFGGAMVNSPLGLAAWILFGLTAVLIAV